MKTEKTSTRNEKTKVKSTGKTVNPEKVKAEAKKNNFNSFFHESISKDTIDFTMLFIILFISMVGLVTLVSVCRPTEGNRSWIFQCVYFCVGLVLMGFVSLFNMRFFTNKWILVALTVVTIGLCVLCRMPGLGTDTSRAISLGNIITIQPSEIYKILVILLVSYFYSSPGVELMNRYNRWIKKKDWTINRKKFYTLTFFKRDLIVVALVGGVTAVLIFWWNNHLSATIICIAITAIIMFVGGANKKFMAFLMAAVVIGGIGYLAPTISVVKGVKEIRQQNEALYEQQADNQDAINENQDKINQIYEDYIGAGDNKDWRKARFVGWLDKDFADRTQNDNALYAIADGGFFGRGIGKSVLKYSHVPVAASDMIFCIYCNETGVWGFLLFIAMFMIFFVRGCQIAIGLDYKKESKNDIHRLDGFAKLVTVGIISHILIQVILNMFVNLDMMPNTGITLPFFSKGGSSIVVVMVEMGILLSCSRQSKIKKEKEVVEK